MQKGDIDMFPCLQDVVSNVSVNTGDLFALISQHLQELTISFGQYFQIMQILEKETFGILINLQRILIHAILTLLRKNRLWNFPAIPRRCPSTKIYLCHSFGYRLQPNVLN